MRSVLDRVRKGIEGMRRSLEGMRKGDGGFCLHLNCEGEDYFGFDVGGISKCKCTEGRKQLGIP